MVVIQFFENNTLVLSQLVNNIPAVDENIKIKGRKGKVLSVKEADRNVIHVHVALEKVVKKQLLLKDDKKRRR
ncbi:hypothetical protein [Metabacillus fastidiosus]|uniref:hypothetical protein n=1 Tax=Metabacillus fastidiosus TaxID=1458 RepID=UPI002E21A88D|nr:hypothetical protein [Metabacillus fastidiosus]